MLPRHTNNTDCELGAGFSELNERYPAKEVSRIVTFWSGMNITAGCLLCWPCQTKELFGSHLL